MTLARILTFLKIHKLDLRRTPPFFKGFVAIFATESSISPKYLHLAIHIRHWHKNEAFIMSTHFSETPAIKYLIALAVFSARYLIMSVTEHGPRSSQHVQCSQDDVCALFEIGILAVLF